MQKHATSRGSLRHHRFLVGIAYAEIITVVCVAEDFRHGGQLIWRHGE